ncbi:DUF817 domain-containing protein [Cellulomonas alba]|uniref:DUF817 domain-containing protein n=1 Tax=Cellulomonas alba TaxID=3053467 RepID=A0ABT7SBY4_9CELL|nr:DUF817 domain-containing protein [Cellulomonas alba]MDM7853698.1 DUF817 domain-containing protein [Cellulomonas alba]
MPDAALPTPPRHPRSELTVVEARIDAWANRRLARVGAGRVARALVELVVFVLKQGWAAVFGGAMLAAIALAHVAYPDSPPLARNDALTLVAVGLQVAMLASRLETLRELRVVLVFHVVGTAMELFKTDAGSWSYATDGVLRIGAVPLFSGFMYAAVGSYLVRVFRIFDLRFDGYPRRSLAAVVAAAAYANFFTHRWVADVRWWLVAAVVVVFGRCTMHYRVHRGRHRMPVVVAFGLVACAIWAAENVATRFGAWAYPSQVVAWHPVGIGKVGSWFLLMLISVALVTWVYPPRPLAGATAEPATAPAPAPATSRAAAADA